MKQFRKVAAAFLALAMVVCSGLLVMNLIQYARGTPDDYPHQHLRLLLGNISVLLLGSASLGQYALQLKTAQPSSKQMLPFYLLITLGIGVLISQIALGRG